jgi:hypothetical protein
MAQMDRAVRSQAKGESRRGVVGKQRLQERAVAVRPGCMSPRGCVRP